MAPDDDPQPCSHALREPYSQQYSAVDQSAFTSRCLACGMVIRRPPNTPANRIPPRNGGEPSR